MNSHRGRTKCKTTNTALDRNTYSSRHAVITLASRNRYDARANYSAVLIPTNKCLINHSWCRYPLTMWHITRATRHVGHMYLVPFDVTVLFNIERAVHICGEWRATLTVGVSFMYLSQDLFSVGTAAQVRPVTSSTSLATASHQRPDGSTFGHCHWPALIPDL